MFGSERDSGQYQRSDSLTGLHQRSGWQQRVPWLGMSGLRLSERTASLAVQAGKLFLLVASVFTVYHVVN